MKKCETVTEPPRRNDSSGLVSIIVPVYNVEKELPRCLRSLQCQTYQNIEVVLVDDGSTDNSGLLCDQFSAICDTCTLIHQQNGGLSAARNTGLDASKGDYVFFLDSDDYLHPSTISTLVGLAETHAANIVECSYFKVLGSEYVPSWHLPTNPETFEWHKPEILRRALLSQGIQIIACGKLYQKQLFATIRFPIGKLHEDEFVTPYIAELAETYVKTTAPLYAYVQRDSSIMNSSFSRKRLDILEAMQQRIEHFTKAYNGQYDEIVFYTYGTVCSRLLCQFGKQMLKQDRDLLEREAIRMHEILGHAKNLPRDKKLSLFAQKHCPHVFWWFCRSFLD